MTTGLYNLLWEIHLLTFFRKYGMNLVRNEESKDYSYFNFLSLYLILSSNMII